MEIWQVEDSMDIEDIVDAWLVAEASEKGSPEYENNSWAADKVSEWSRSGEGAILLWQFVIAAYTRDMPIETFAMLAAGPLEELLAVFGEEYIDRVEDLARRDPKFNRLLGGVWRNNMTDEVWERVQAIRNEVW